MTKFEKVTQQLLEIYEAKNADYGNSFSELYHDLGLISAVVQIVHKTHRLKTLVKKGSLSVKDESIIDTLKDLANYSILTLMELEGEAFETVDDLNALFKTDQDKLFENVQEWFVVRDMLHFDGSVQIRKLKEEVDELALAHKTSNRAEEMDALGDILIVLTGYALQRDLDLTSCLAIAYDEIKDRKGKLVDGDFIKESDLCG